MLAIATDIVSLNCHFFFLWLAKAVPCDCCVSWVISFTFSIQFQGSFSGAIFSHFFFCKKSYQNSRSEKKNRTMNFSHFVPLSSYFAHAVHFETIGLICLTGFWIIVAPKFITHTTAGNHSLICIIEKLYRKNSLSVSGLSNYRKNSLSVSDLSKWFFFIATSSQQKHVRRLGGKKRKKIILKPSSWDGNMLKYLVRAQPSSTKAATLSSPDLDEDQTQDRAEPDE